MTNFLTENNLIEDSQQGSRGGRGTITQLIKQHDVLVENLAKGNNMDINYLDFSKAFDLVDHSLLLRKLKEKGFRGDLLLWLKAFLSNRSQRVRVGQTLSRKAGLHSGVPQGSVLGPLFFLVFISDLDDSLQDAAVSILKYVDDSKVLSKVQDNSDVIRTQESLNKVYLWADKNNMCWNQTKFQVLRIGKDSNLKDSTFYYAPNGTNIIERKECIKDLGVLIDQDLTYRSHRQKALKKVFQKIGWIKHTFSTRTVPFLKILWNSLVQPHLDYGSILTAPTNKCEIRVAEKPLKNFTKLAHEGKNLHYWKRLELFRLFSNQRRMERYKICYIMEIIEWSRSTYRSKMAD